MGGAASGGGTAGGTRPPRVVEGACCSPPVIDRMYVADLFALSGQAKEDCNKRAYKSKHLVKKFQKTSGKHLETLYSATESCRIEMSLLMSPMQQKAGKLGATFSDTLTCPHA